MIGEMTDHSPRIELREITDANRAAVVALHAGSAEGRFVSSVAISLEEAAEDPDGSPWYRAVVPLEADGRRAPPGPRDRSGDHDPSRGAHPGRGRAGLFTSHVVGPGGPGGFYERLGFVPTGTFDPDGERILRLDLSA